jgi:hypothetical protein
LSSCETHHLASDQLLKSTFDHGYFLHLAGLKDTIDEFLPQLAEKA